MKNLTEESMTTLFDPLRVGEIELDNRIVMAPMTRSRADDEGIQPPYAAEYYRQRASAGRLVEVLRAGPIRGSAAGLFALYTVGNGS
jgi:2,4-dienoyl-CoA reductase-like NADH-dependent reductase (Old Yellow Enzyme family)